MMDIFLNLISKEHLVLDVSYSNSKNQYNCDTEGIISTLAGIMGTMQANEVIKSIINSKNDLSGKMIV